MLTDNLAGPLSLVATHSFTKMHDPKKLTIQRIFISYWEDFLNDPEIVRRGLRPVVKKEVLKMMSCGTLDSGFEIYECPNCQKSHIICYTCKNRFCNSCGIRYTKLRVQNISTSIHNISHRHAIFSID